MWLMFEDKLSNVSGHKEDDKGCENDDEEESNPDVVKDVPFCDESDGRWREHEGHDCDEKISGLFDLWEFNEFEAQSDKHEHEAV